MYDLFWDDYEIRDVYSQSLIRFQIEIDVLIVYC